MLGLAFAVVYLQSRHTLREEQKRPVLVQAGILTIRIAFDAPWFVVSHVNNRLMLVEENEKERKLLKEWPEIEFLKNPILKTPKLELGKRYRIQGFLQACGGEGNAKNCVPYFADVAIEVNHLADLREISLPYLPRFQR